MKIGCFTDTHYCSKPAIGDRIPQDGYNRLVAALTAFSAHGVNFTVFLGDLVDTEAEKEKNIANLKTIAAPLRSAPMPVLCLMGNHDRNLFTPAEFCAISGLQTAPADCEVGDVVLHAFDANNFYSGEPYTPGHIDWTQCRVMPEEVERLRKAAADRSKKHIWFVHQCLAPDSDSYHLIQNAPELRAVIATAPTLAVFCGHYHPGLRSICDGIPYYTLPALCCTPRDSAVIFDTDTLTLTSV